jgi:hypothetical protein
MLGARLAINPQLADHFCARIGPVPWPPLLELAQDHDPAGLGQRLGHMLGLVPPHDHGIERARRTPHLAYSFLRRTGRSVS